MDIREYVGEDGTNAYEKWFNCLNRMAAVKVATARARLESGKTSSVKWFKGIGEYKIDWGPGYRIYLAQDGQELIILFGGGTKKSQQSDIAKAQKLYQEYKRRKNSDQEDRSI